VAAPRDSDTPRGPARGEAGQTLVVMAIFMVVLLSFVAVVIDGGMFFMQRRSIQGDADAAALAAVRELPAHQATATSIAEQYAEVENHDDASLESVNITENGTKIQVVLTTQGNASFTELLGKAPPTIRTRATAKVQMMGPRPGMLPIALMRDTFTLGAEANIKDDGTGSANKGPITVQLGSACGFGNGANDFRDVIAGSAHGGIDACAMPIGTVADTEPGNMAGPTRQGFDNRIGSNTDSFSDVFELDSSTGLYTIKKPDSPRIGIVPVVEQPNGSNTWPAGRKPIKILAYMLVYIGKNGTAGYPAYTNNGKDVWVTPIRAILPNNFGGGDGGFVEYSANLPAPVVYRLTN
jgi:hypothetical protein